MAPAFTSAEVDDNDPVTPFLAGIRDVANTLAGGRDRWA